MTVESAHVTREEVMKKIRDLHNTTIKEFRALIQRHRPKLYSEVDPVTKRDISLLDTIEKHLMAAAIAAAHLSDKEVQEEIEFGIAALHHDVCIRHYMEKCDPDSGEL